MTWCSKSASRLLGLAVYMVGNYLSAAAALRRVIKRSKSARSIVRSISAAYFYERTGYFDMRVLDQCFAYRQDLIHYAMRLMAFDRWYYTMLSMRVQIEIFRWSGLIADTCAGLDSINKKEG